MISTRKTLLGLALFATVALSLLVAAPSSAQMDCSACDCTDSCSTTCILGYMPRNCNQDTCEYEPIYSTCNATGYCTTGSNCSGPTGCQALACTNTINGDANNNTINGTSNRDCIYGQGGNDTIDGNAGDDKIWGGPGTDTLYGDSGNDCLYGQGGADHTDGESGSLDYCEGETEVNCEL